MSRVAGALAGKLDACICDRLAPDPDPCCCEPERADVPIAADGRTASSRPAEERAMSAMVTSCMRTPASGFAIRAEKRGNANGRLPDDE